MEFRIDEDLTLEVRTHLSSIWTHLCTLPQDTFAEFLVTVFENNRSSHATKVVILKQLLNDAYFQEPTARGTDKASPPKSAKVVVDKDTFHPDVEEHN